MTTQRFDFWGIRFFEKIYCFGRHREYAMEKLLKDLNWEMRRRRLCFPLAPSHSPCPPAGKLTSAFFSGTDEATSGLFLLLFGLVVDEVRVKVGREDLFLCSSWYSGMLRLLRPDLCPRRLERGWLKSA